jgi:hypothetical protein
MTTCCHALENKTEATSTLLLSSHNALPHLSVIKETTPGLHGRQNTRPRVEMSAPLSGRSIPLDLAKIVTPVIYVLRPPCHRFIHSSCLAMLGVFLRQKRSESPSHVFCFKPTLWNAMVGGGVSARQALKRHQPLTCLGTTRVMSAIQLSNGCALTVP